MEEIKRSESQNEREKEKKKKKKEQQLQGPICIMKSMQITPLITFNLLDSHDNAEISMYDNEAQTGLSDQPTCILSHTYSITYVFSD